MKRVGCIRLAITAGVCLVGFTGSAAAVVARCPNEAFRVGRSASLPDCRAYELVTPDELGRTADLLFEANLDHAVAASDGEHVALVANGGGLIEPGVSVAGTRAVFSRNPTGWSMQSVAPPGAAGETISLELLSPDFSQVAFESSSAWNRAAGSTAVFEAGPVGGPYTTLVSLPPNIEREGGTTSVDVANAGAPGVPPFSDVVLRSKDHALLPPGPEREAAEAMPPGLDDLYEWAEGRLHLLNVNNEGKLLNLCGATAGAGGEEALNAVSADGSKVFFTSPQAREEPSCLEPSLYMRVDGRETVEISEPEGVSIEPSERGEACYDGASADGSRVFFTTANALTPGAGAGSHLYEYDTEAPEHHRLTPLVNEAPSCKREYINPSVVVSEDGAQVYYQGYGPVPGDEAVSKSGIFRYETATGHKSFVSTTPVAPNASEPYYTTPNGGFLVFPGEPISAKTPSHGLIEFLGPHGFEVEPRGNGHNEIYRYDAATGSVMCVSCGEGVAPAKGKTLLPTYFYGFLSTADSSPTVSSISNDGRRVFFQTSAKLVPQDTNESTPEEEQGASLGKDADVYEWQEVGTEEAPGVFCGVANGCTHLLSAGEAVGPERFLGASTDGRNVFFTSSAQLVPQATPEFTNIYDARVEGGFPPPPPTSECTSCQGVGSPPPSFGPGASGTFGGAGNPGAPISKPKPAPKSKCKHGYTRGKRGKCVRAKSRKRDKRS